jgi:2-dehydropantoate 2-reductase
VAVRVPLLRMLMLSIGLAQSPMAASRRASSPSRSPTAGRGPGVAGGIAPDRCPLPEGLLVTMLRRFLRSPTAAYSGLGSASPAPTAELERLAEQMRAYARVR